jgi:hypothetical protein
MWKELHRWISVRCTSSVADKRGARPTPRLSHLGIQGGSNRSKREVIADRVWAVNSSSQSSSREPGAADENYDSSKSCGGSSFDDDEPFYEAKAEMARTTRRTDGEAGGLQEAVCSFITATISRMSGESALPPWGQDLVGPSPLEPKAGGHAHPHI